MIYFSNNEQASSLITESINRKFTEEEGAALLRLGERSLDELQSYLAAQHQMMSYILSVFLSVFIITVLIVSPSAFVLESDSWFLTIIVAFTATLLSPIAQRILEWMHAAR